MSYTEIQNQILNQMPHFIAINYKAMLDAPNDKERVQAGLATFDRCLRLLTFILVSQYLIRDQEGISDPYLNKLLTDRFFLGDLKIWRDIFLTTLKAYEGHPDLLFMPEVYHLCWDVSNPERHCPRPETIQVLDRLVALSNDWQSNKHLPTEATGWKALANEITISIDEVLKRLTFLEEYELICINKGAKSEYEADLHKGLQITPVIFEYKGETLQPNWYYMDKNRSDFLLLNPLLASWQMEQQETAIFSRLTSYDQLRYLLSLTGGLLTDQTHLEEFRNLMDIIAETKYDIHKKSRKKLTWLQLTATATEITNERMQTVSDKFDRDLYLQRDNVWSLFKTFMASEARCFVLTGKSGAGKSNFVLSLQDEYKTQTDICLLMMDASSIDAGKGLSAFINDEFRRHWGLHAEEMPVLWEEIDRLPDMEHRTVLLVLDAINENTQPRELLKQTNELLVWKWLKILITSRPEALRRMCHGLHLMEGLFFRPLGDANTPGNDRPYLSAHDMETFAWEELQAVYGCYQAKFNLKTNYGDLSPEVCHLIREPLQLWMVASTYQGEIIPKALPAGKLIEDYIETLIKTQRLYPEDIRFLQHELVPLLVPEPGQYTNIITTQALEKAGSNLLERVFSEGQYSTGERVNEQFQRLADAQIIVPHIQGTDSIVRFKYERFFDHFLGKFLFERQIKPIKPATDIIKVYQGLIDASEDEDYSFLWGAVKYAIYLILDVKPDVIKYLAFKDSLNVTYLISAILEDYSQSNPEIVRHLIGEIISLSTANRSNFPLTHRLQATEVALCVASTLNDKESFIRVLLDKKAIIRDVGIKYTYYHSKREQSQTLEILRIISEEVTKPTLTLNIPALQSTFRLTPLLMLDCYQKGALAGSVDNLLLILHNTSTQILNKTLFRIFRPVVRTWVTYVFVKIFIELVSKVGEGEKGTSINNAYEYKRFFSEQSKDLRNKVRNSLVYINRSYGSWSEISDLVMWLYQTGDRVSDTMADYIVDGRGIHSPWEAEPVLHRVIDEIDDPTNNIYLFAVARWYTIMSRQPTVPDKALETMKKFVSGWLDSNKDGYGVLKRYKRIYQYYPLNAYSALWTKMYPGHEIDLLQEYIHRTKNDQQLLIHIIDSFGDLRTPLYDYRPALRVLSPYVRVSDKTIREHMVKSLGSLRGLYPLSVEHFLLESEAPCELVNDIRSYSYQKPSNELYLRFSQFLSDLFAYAPIEFVQNIIEIFDEAIEAHSFEQMAAILINKFLDMIIGEERLNNDSKNIKG